MNEWLLDQPIGLMNLFLKPTIDLIMFRYEARTINPTASPDFLNGIWTKIKPTSKTLMTVQISYSFLHIGAILVFEKTGSLQTLQAVMGHSDLKVSLTYLRGLEVK